MWTVPDALKLTEEQRRTLSSWVAARNTPQKVVFRACIVLLAAEGKANRRIAQELGTSRPSVILWRRRFQQGGTTALTEDRPGRGRKATISAARVKQIVEATLHSKPPAATHWSVRTMARAQHVSPATGATHLGCAWLRATSHAHLQTVARQAVSREAYRCGGPVLYLNPPDKALVLSVDEKSQIQALNRTQPGLPMKKGRCGTMTHDYKRNGTTTLFAALDVLEGKVIGECMARHRHREFLKFLRRLDRELPAHLDLHLIVDNY